MNKSFVTLLLIVSCIGISYGQQTATKAKLSPLTQRYLLEYKKHSYQAPGKLPNYNYKRINNKVYVSGMIKVSSNIDEQSLNAAGALTGTKAGNIWTVQVPADSMAAFTNVAGISYIELDVPIFPLLDSARKDTRADSAQKGINLPSPVTGKNVVMGVVDAGFDFNHPTMYDTAYSQYRIKRVWTQKISGTPPTGYSYGNEMTDTSAIKVLGFDTAILSHGSHVAGIAGGSGYSGNGTNGKYRGMAFESDLVFVGIMPAPGEWISAGESDIVDGINYIFNYATSVGKPAVVNLSWGATLGSHDGNSLFSQACDALTGAGKIFVCAAGNNGQDTVHLQKSFTTTDTTVSTFVTFSQSLDSNNQYNWVDAWGDTGKTFCLNVKLYNGETAIDSTDLICLADTTTTYNLIGSNGDTCFVTVTTVTSDYNDKPHAFVSFYSRVHDNICLTAKATSGVLDMWAGYVAPPEGYYGYLQSLGYPWAVSGDVKMTVSDIGCTRSAITVGAYNSKLSFTNILGEALIFSGFYRSRIAPFSSIGPTEDYRIKPDITAPGFALASSVNSHDTSYNAGGINYNTIVSADTIGGKIYNYAMLQGTSMASPCVAGIVAMMLQLDPTLTPDSVKAIINATAITDTYTGTLPATGTTTWGHGKINAYRAVKAITGDLSVANTLTTDPLACILYPNPNKGGFTISYKSDIQEPLTVELFDLAGNSIYKQYWQVNAGSNIKQFNVATLAKGIYLTKISGQKGYNLVKTIIE